MGGGPHGGGRGGGAARASRSHARRSSSRAPRATRKSWTSRSRGSFALYRRTISGARNGTPSAVLIPARARGLVIRGSRRNRHVGPSPSLRRISSSKVPSGERAWTSWSGGPIHSPSAQGIRVGLPRATRSSRQPRRWSRRVPWSPRRIATSTSSWARVSRSTRRSIAQPPATHHGRRKDSRTEATFRTGSKGSMSLDPVAQLPEGALLVLRRAREDLERQAPVVPGRADGPHVPLHVDRPLPEREVLVPLLPVPAVVVVDVDEGEAVLEGLEVRPAALVPLVEVRVPDVEAEPHLRDRVEGLPQDVGRLVDVLEGHGHAPFPRGLHEVPEPRRLHVVRDLGGRLRLEEMDVEEPPDHGGQGVQETDQPAEGGVREPGRREVGRLEGDRPREGRRLDEERGRRQGGGGGGGLPASEARPPPPLGLLR